jgi:azurin
MKKKWTALAGVAIMIVVTLVIFFIARGTLRGPGPAQRAGTANSGSPEGLPEQTLPTVSVQNPDQLRQGQYVPLLQRDVTPDQVTRVFELGTTANVPGYDKTLLVAKRGDVISVHFRNNSNPKFNYHHSFVLTKPEKADEVMMQAYRVGAALDFIPKSDDVLAASKLIGPGETDTVLFRAPDQPGDYPYICTFPGHGKAMRGTLRIE